MTDGSLERKPAHSVDGARKLVYEMLGIVDCSLGALCEITSVSQKPYGSMKFRFNKYTWEQLRKAVRGCNLLNRLSTYADIKEKKGECEQTRLLLKGIRADFSKQLGMFDNDGVRIVNGRQVERAEVAA